MLLHEIGLGDCLHPLIIKRTARSDEIILDNNVSHRSAVTSLRCLDTTTLEVSTRAGILPGYPSLDKGSREAAVRFEPRTLRSVNLRSNHRAISPIPNKSSNCVCVCAVNAVRLRNALLVRSLKILRQPMTGFALLGALQYHESQTEAADLGLIDIQRKNLHNSSTLNAETVDGCKNRRTWNPAESLVCDVLRQLNVLHQVASCFSGYDIQDIAMHVYLCKVLLIRLLKIRRQLTPSIALLETHQCLTAMPREGSSRTRILPCCPSLDRERRQTDRHWFRATDLPVSKFVLLPLSYLAICC
ncbi:hypothetical protein T265_02393 [Opisthorchis viverrini]|uniref:Uncharacterized protein n=1 Tax=Opisthorchis viverrini TaxID=6198 RepID=A0A074ZW40_OPIVI|nr:hypothetical protein T265_02393 [Opisthorchis viverrini]KER31341.1 hypothetical protein T265_02393 [Opisthorchis viverrini]